MSLFMRKKEKTTHSHQSPFIATGRKPTIKVLGAGCKSCHQQYENVKEAVGALGVDADVQYITDMVQVSAYGVMKLPAIVIDEQIVSSGKIVKVSEIVDMLRK